MRVEKVPQRGGIEQRPGVASAKNCTEGQIHDPSDRISRLGKNIAAKDVGGPQFSPEPRQYPGCQREFVATYRQSASIHRSSGRASNDWEGIAMLLDAS